MAYIFSKNSGHCLIIGPQESITLPFNFGNFQEVRMGGFFSVVSAGTGNFNTPFSAITGNINSSLNNLFIGFKDTGKSLPGISGSSFVGITKKLTDTQNAITPTTLNFGGSTSVGAGGNYLTIDTTGNQIFYSTQAQNPMSITIATGNSGFASFWGITLGIINNTFSGMAIYDTNFYTDVSTGNLNRLVNTPPLVSSFITGFYTTGGLNTSNVLMQPKAIYIYFPFLNNQLRIHGIDIEQFS